ncbi:uncharacterized protein CTRU02_205655 [Colletotrichum truncatum]|uniref:Uncharacterized protein n=1 Tax=Colletotrichum truncatum TaxID=5467 RepID=A0ACC3Z4Y8_COLTU|nr:uncharacterized protein CTRU02_09407 [Colletotrichum truncatum]KAF6788599.1 hypothetical protein CTRU02_09407 [Colletotrichum truncatum]
MKDSDALSPPKRSSISDPGAHDLAESSDSEDHFSDAQSAPLSPGASPIPKTRVEKVDDEPSYGEVPGTEAYRMREGDAEPDEIAIQEKNSEKPSSEAAPPSPPGGQPIPKTVVEEVPGTSGPHSEEYQEKRKADAPADLVLKPEGETKGGESSSVVDLVSFVDIPVSPALPASPSSPRMRRKPSRNDLSSASPSISLAPPPTEEDEESDGGDDFGDDFDDFEEGEEADGDFDDFEDGFQQPEFETTAPASAPTLPQVPTLPFSIPDFDGLDGEDVLQAVDPYLNTLFPPENLDVSAPPPLTKENPIFLTPRSASLWSQLVAPPPLAPPDWIRSRIRRLFLVSLGVPVDLDEILPASKQKKLVLPSLQVNSSGSPRTSSESRSISRVRQSEANASTTSVDSKGKPSASKKKVPPPVPDLDLVSAKQLCTTTEEALNGMTDEELKAHVTKLQAMEGTAKEVLEYWTKKTDEKIGDREAFEGVIENLVKHARKVRK